MKPIFMLWCSVALLSTVAHSQSVRLEDSSDWWSVNREDPRIPTVKPSNHELPPSSFNIAGVPLGKGGFEAITARLGSAPVVERGDASTGRSQVCYAPATASAVRLIFEFGEDESLFYLFSGGASWKGSKYCVKSKQVSLRSSTKSGLRLGLTPAEVESILGRPNTATPTEFVCSREFEKKSSPQEFETQRKQYPTPLSDEEAHKKFDFYPVEQYILARFKASKLVYLAVSTSGSGD
jgi:hypothetical protein